MPRPQKGITVITEMQIRNVIGAIERGMNITEATRVMKIDRRVLHHQLKVRPDLAEELRHAHEVGKAHYLEMLETKLREHIEEGNVTALIFKLKQMDPSYRDSYHVTTSTAPTDYVIDLTLPSGEAQPTDGATTTVLE